MKYLFLLLFCLGVNAGIPEGLQLIEITNANQPVGFVKANDGSMRRYILERSGVIKLFINKEQSVFLDISKKIEDTFNDQGLLGMVFDPNFTENGFFYVNYTSAGGQYDFGVTTIERYYFNHLTQLAEVNSAKTILTVDQFYHNHNGGTMHFGLDGYLYIAMGDGGMRRDPQNFAQNPSELLGKMLRIDVDPDIVFNNGVEYDNRCAKIAHYYLAKDNPFVGDINTCGEIFLTGLRSPWQWSFDRLNGDIFVGDVGQDNEEEISYVSSSSLGGENLGWSCKEGSTVILPERCPDDMTTLTDPIISYLHNPDNSGNSIVGGYRYRGSAIAELYGQYIYADTVSGELRFAEYDGKQWLSTKWMQSVFLIVAFAEDESGELYVVNFNGSISKFVVM